MKRSILLLALLTMTASAFCLTKEEFPNVVIYHDNEDRNTLREIDELIARENETIRQFLGVTVPKRELYVYRYQKEMQRQKHPILSFVLKPDWYIGDNIGQRALIVSPNTAVNGHSYESILGAIPHEYVHTVVYSMNKKCSLWVNEGLALYLANRESVSTSERAIPPLKIFTSKDSVYFANNGGYQYADKFIEFVDAAYGHDALMALVKDNRYEKVLGKPIGAIYDEWKNYLRRMYP